MAAIDFEERNDYIGKPPNLTDKQCCALPVCRIITHIPGETEDDEPKQVLAHVSCWELSEEEVAQVVRTGRVYVKIIGATLFPMSVHGIKPIYPGEDKLSDIVLTEERIAEMKSKG